MTLPRQGGGKGVTDFETQQAAALVQRTYRLWQNEGIWSKWVNRRYIADRPLAAIERKRTDVPAWKQTLNNRETIDKCLDCRQGGQTS